MRVYAGLDVSSDFGGRFPWKSQLLDVGGARQAFVDEGPRGAPLTFLCLHGNPTWGFIYRRFIEHLSPRFRVVAPDHVGFGRSDKPRDRAYYSLERHVRNLEQLAEHLRLERVVPIVQDWGGPIGLGWATRHPERVAGLVILNTWAFVRAPQMKLPWLFRWLVLGRGGWNRATGGNIFVELLLARGGTRRLEGAELEAYRAPFPTPEERTGVGRFPMLIPPTDQPSHESWSTMAGIEDGLERLRDKPALLVWATKDPAFKRPVMERWQGAFTRVDGPHLLRAGHYLQEDDPGPILQHVDRWVGRELDAPA